MYILGVLVSQISEMPNLSLMLDNAEFNETTAVALTPVDRSIQRTIKLVFCTIYILIFIVGTVGNGYSRFDSRYN